MTKRPTAYHRPKSLEEALSLLAKPNAVPLGGGTTLLASDFSGTVVDLQDVGLDQIRSEKGQLFIGATTRLTDLAEFLALTKSNADAPDLGDCSTLLAEAVHRAGPNTYRNMATLGGVIAARLPDSELLSALLVLDAELTFADAGQSSVTLMDFLDANEKPPGLITEIALRWETGRGASERVARTPADYPIVSVTIWWAQEKEPRLAATGIDDRPVRLLGAEAVLADGLTGDRVMQAAAAAKAQASHPGDFRGDADYRAEMAAVLTKRVLNTVAP